MKLFDAEVLDRLEELNERYRVLGERIAELEGRINEAASFDLSPDTEALGALVDARCRVKEQAAKLLRELLEELEL